MSNRWEGQRASHATPGSGARCEWIDTPVSQRAPRPLVLLFFLLAGVTWCVACEEEAPEPEPVARPVKMVEFGGAGQGSQLEYPGEVSPATNAEVAFEVAGKLIAFPVTESQQVERGDVLAKLDPRDYQANLDAAKARVSQSRAEYSRVQALFREDVASEQQLEQAQSDHEVIVAQVQKAQKAVEDTTLRAPFDGTIARKIANDFDNVRAKQPIVLLHTGGALEVVINVPEKDYVRLDPSLTIAERSQRLDAAVVLSAIPDRAFPAALKEFATAADPTTRTFSATFSFTHPDDVSVMPGMTARVVIRGLVAASNASTIPVQAAVESGGGSPYVWLVDRESMVVRKTEITLGALTGSSVEVTAGLENGDLVVTSGVHQLRAGAQVRRLAN